ncbi:GGDEF domain-containing protein [Aquimonas voraii]|uniref:diguanylate cyclase n=1 Tax=Aquimonas voraii TaxID=265719 RepID=A0A1G6SG31_9GAMM|nr:diguanylate cyclase [Aquimonas voraii]SDD15136.1 diguanylate cyclase (GGDEF) domain-containing protein [Aquimonas voraii]
MVRLLSCFALWLLLAGSLPVRAAAGEFPLDVRVLPAESEPAAVARPLPEPGWRNRVLSSAAPRATLLIRPQSGAWPPGDWVLQLRISPLHRVQLEQGEQRSAWTRGLNPQPGLHAGHGDVAFALAELPPGNAPLRVHLDSSGVLASTIALRLLPADEYRAQDAAWLAYAGATLAVMVAMAMMALLFAAYLRDSSFLWYAGYLLAYVWILGLQSGFLAAPLGLSFTAGGSPLSGRIATAAAVACAAMFLDRFAHLDVYAPRLRRGLHLLAGAIVLSSLASVLPSEAWVQAARALTNPLIILGGPLLLVTALWAALRGSRYALIFAIGWAPLLAVTVMGSLQMFGLFSAWRWLDNAGMGAGAFEALVLSAGLAYRSMELRRDRDSARHLADVDPLTGLLNRRAWSERVRRLMADQPDGLCVLFIDLDHFKALNDAHGHDLGDRALADVAACLKRSLRAHDLLARHGGEELVAALPRCGLDAAARIAEQLRRAASNLRFAAEGPQGESPRLTLSIGVARQRPGESLESLIRRADAAMYTAKRSGRDRVEVDREGA